MEKTEHFFLIIFIFVKIDNQQIIITFAVKIFYSKKWII
jgi:hypothetical protein